MSSNYTLYNGADPWAGTDWYRPAPNPTQAYAEQAAQPPPQFDPYEPMPQYQPGAQRPLGTLEALAASGNRSFLGRLGAIKLAKRRQQEQQQEEAYKRQFYEWKTRREDAENRRKDKAQERDDYVLVDTVDANGKHVKKFVKKGEPGEFPAPPKEYAPDRSKSESEMTPEEHAAYLDRKNASEAKYRRPEKPDKPPEPPSSVREYNLDVQQGYKGTFKQWRAENAQNERKPEADREMDNLTSDWAKGATDPKSSGGVAVTVTEEERLEAAKRGLNNARSRGKKTAAPAPTKAAPPKPSSTAPITHTTKDGRLGWNGKEWVALK